MEMSLKDHTIRGTSLIELMLRCQVQEIDNAFDSSYAHQKRPVRCMTISKELTILL